METITGSGTDGVTFDATYYGSIAGAHAYFAVRLNERAWSLAKPVDRPKALWAATQVIDTLNFKGQKADPAQVLEFPRGCDSVVPRDIEVACYELAHSLLDGRDPETELESLGITSAGYSSVRTTYDRSKVPFEHLINGVPNALAWRLIRPYLRDGDDITLSRV